MSDKKEAPLAKVVEKPSEPQAPKMVEKLIPISDKQASQLQSLDMQIQGLQIQYEASVKAIIAGEDVPDQVQFHGITESKKLLGGKKFALKLMIPKQ